MRHLWSLLAGIVVAPITWLLIAMGQGGSNRTVAGWVNDGHYDTTSLIEPAAYLVAAGILLGLLGTLRVSPLGPLTAGLLLVGAYAAMFAAPFAIHDNVPGNERIFGRPLPLHLPLDNGTLLLLGALLLMATFSVQRWRPWPAATSAAATESPTTGATLAGASTAGGPAEGGAADETRIGDDDAAATVAGATTEPVAGPAPGVPVQRSGDARPDRLTPLPQRRDSQSPWSTPPQGAAKQESTTD